LFAGFFFGGAGEVQLEEEGVVGRLLQESLNLG
jgi:hypothetical protein